MDSSSRQHGASYFRQLNRQAEQLRRNLKPKYVFFLHERKKRERKSIVYISINTIYIFGKGVILSELDSLGKI